jgi:hypothetical protein
VELKRIEHERQRLLQRKIFEDQMRALEQQQAQELLSIPYDAATANGAGMQHLAVSAPTTPPRINAALPNEFLPGILTHRSKQAVDADSLLKAVGSAAVLDKRKAVTLAPMDHLPESVMGVSNGGQNYARPVGAKSMPASRRTSASGDDDDLSSHLQGLSLAGERPNRASPAPTPVTAPIMARSPGRYGEDERTRYVKTFNAGMMLDQQLDQEMHSKPLFSPPRSLISNVLSDAMRNLPTSDDDKYHRSFSSQVRVACFTGK